MKLFSQWPLLALALLVGCQPVQLPDTQDPSPSITPDPDDSSCYPPPLARDEQQLTLANYSPFSLSGFSQEDSSNLVLTGPSEPPYLALANPELPGQLTLVQYNQYSYPSHCGLDDLVWPALTITIDIDAVGSCANQQIEPPAGQILATSMLQGASLNLAAYPELEPPYWLQHAGAGQWLNEPEFSPSQAGIYQLSNPIALYNPCGDDHAYSAHHLELTLYDTKPPMGLNLYLDANDSGMPLPLGETARITYGHAPLAATGELLWFDEQALQALQAQASANDAETWLTIGHGYNRQQSSTEVSLFAVLAGENSRGQLLSSISQLANRLQLDGIELGYRWPSSAQEQADLAEFVEQLSNELNPPGLPDQPSQKVDVAVVLPVDGQHGQFIDDQVLAIADRLHIRAYQGFDLGADPQATSSAPLAMAVDSLDYWLNQRQASHGKLSLGLPLYCLDAGWQKSYRLLVDWNQADPYGDQFQDNCFYNGLTTALAKQQLARDHGIGLSLYNPDFDSQGQYSILRALRQQPLLPSP